MNKLRKIAISLVGGLVFSTGIFYTANAAGYVDFARYLRSCGCDIIYYDVEAQRRENGQRSPSDNHLVFDYYIEDSGMSKRLYDFGAKFAKDEIFKEACFRNGSNAADVVASYIKIKKIFEKDPCWPEIQEIALHDIVSFNLQHNRVVAKGFLTMKDLTSEEVERLVKTLKEVKEEDLKFTECDYHKAVEDIVDMVDSEMSCMQHSVKDGSLSVEEDREENINKLRNMLRCFRNINFLDVKKAGEKFRFRNKFYEGVYVWDLDTSKSTYLANDEFNYKAETVIADLD